MVLNTEQRLIFFLPGKILLFSILNIKRRALWNVPSTKKKIAQTIDDLPEKTTIEEAIERLMLLHKVEVGLRQSQEGRGMSQSKIEDHFQQRRESRKSE